MTKHQNKNILIVCYQGHGHVSPALQFTNRVTKMGVSVTFLSSFSVIQSINKETMAHDLVLVPFSDGHDKGKQPTTTWEQYYVDFSKNGACALEEILNTSAAGTCQPQFDHVVYTTAVPWAGRVANALNVKSTLLSCQPAICLDIYYYYFNGYAELISSNGNNPAFTFNLPGLPPLTVADLPSFLAPSSSKEYECFFHMFKEHIDVLKTSPRVLVNTYNELELEPIKSVEKLIHFLPIGPLLPLELLDEKNITKNEVDGYLKWLNEKPKQSVVYVSMGSIANLEMEQAEEVAHGLLESGFPFLWVIRESAQAEKLSKIDELKKQGMIVSWCSQLKVLSHEAIGCFVTHGGWNSTLESLVWGVPKVSFPQWADQAVNTKMIKDVWKVGVRVSKRESDGIVEANEIKRCVQLVMGDAEMRKNSEKWKRLAREALDDEGSSTINLRAFLDDA